MQDLSKCLQKWGYFLMHSPSHYSEEDASGEDSFVGEHARTGYSKEDIEKKLMESDLIPVDTNYTYGKWGRRSWILSVKWPMIWRSEEHTSELQSRGHLVCRLLLEKKHKPACEPALR